MKKLFALLSISLLIIFISPSVHAQTAPIKTSSLLTHTYDVNGWYFVLDTLAGKAPVMIQVYDSTTSTWATATVACDSISRRTFGNTRDQAWLTGLLQYQKSYNTFGILPETFYYRLLSTGKLYYPSHYNKLLVYYRP